MTSLFHVLPTPSRPRRSHDRILVGVLTVSLVGLVAELFLRTNGLLPLLPRLDFSVVMFSSFVALAVGGTLLLALTAPAESYDTIDLPRGTALDLRGERTSIAPTSVEADQPDKADEADEADERELVAA